MLELEEGAHYESSSATQGKLFEFSALGTGVSIDGHSIHRDLVLSDMAKEIISFNLNTIQPIEALNILDAMQLRLQNLETESYERADL